MNVSIISALSLNLRKASRQFRTTLILFCLGATTAQAGDDLAMTVTIEGVGSGSVSYSLGLVAAGQTQSIYTIPGTVSPGMAALDARNAVIPWQGSSNGTFEVERVHANGKPGFRAMFVAGPTVQRSHPQAAIYVIGFSDWLVLEPGNSVEFMGLTFRAFSDGMCSPVASGGVPAVSAWGLGILGVVLLVVATLMLRHRANAIAA